MSAIHKKYNIPFDAYIQMVKDGVISTDVILQFEYAETFKILSQGMSETEARQETLSHFAINRSTLWRAISKFG